jgi:hypothetical protein
MEGASVCASGMEMVSRLVSDAAPAMNMRAILNVVSAILQRQGPSGILDLPVK